MKIKQNNSLQGRFRFKEYHAVTGELLRTTDWQKNLIMSAEYQGLNAILKLMQGDDSFGIEITRARIGTGNTAVNENQTDLVAPLAYDIQIANVTEINNKTVLYEFFLPDLFIPNNTYREFATYAGTKMFSRALILPVYVKASNTNTTCEYEFTIANT